MHLLMLGGKILYGRTMIRIFTLQRNYHVHNCNVHMKGRYDEAPCRAHFLIISIEFLFQRITLTNGHWVYKFDKENLLIPIERNL